jgi:hypothetical protein
MDRNLYLTIELGRAMTIATARIYYYPRSQELEQKLTQTHWGFAKWFQRRLKPIREQLRGPEVKGVNIVNFMLHEVPEHAWYPNEWRQRANTFNFSYICNLRPLEEGEPIENISMDLPRFHGQFRDS